jgi:hypothetical protein
MRWRYSFLMLRFDEPFLSREYGRRLFYCCRRSRPNHQLTTQFVFRPGVTVGRDGNILSFIARPLYMSLWAYFPKIYIKGKAALEQTLKENSGPIRVLVVKLTRRHAIASASVSRWRFGDLRHLAKRLFVDAPNLHMRRQDSSFRS